MRALKRLSLVDVLPSIFLTPEALRVGDISCRTLIESRALPKSRWQVSITRPPQDFSVIQGSSMSPTNLLGMDGFGCAG